MEEKSLSKRILERLVQLKNIRIDWEPLWQEIVDYTTPRRRFLNITDRKGQKAPIKIYDGTPISALQMLADGLQGYLVSQALQWFRLVIPDERLMENREVKLWIQEAERHLYSVFQRSNFYASIGEYFLDGGSIGTATMYIDEYEQKELNYDVRHPKEIYIAENYIGKVDTVFREFMFDARKCVQEFGYDNLSLEIKEAARNTPYKDFTIVHAVYPKKDREIDMPAISSKKFSSVYVEEKNDNELRRSGYNTNPFVVWRWRTNSDEIYGRSPVGDAIIEILGLNVIGKTLLSAAHLSVNPAYNIPSRMKGKVDISPAGFNYFRDPQSVISAIHTGVDYPIGVERERDKREIIERHLKVDFFLMLSRMDRVMTATEIIERQGEKAAVLSPMIGRLNSEAMDAIFDRTIILEWDAGRLPELPAILQDQPELLIDIDYTGPLAQAQRRLFRTQGTMRSLEILLPYNEINPEIFDNINWDSTVRDLLEANGMPQKNINPVEIVKQIRDDRMAKMEEAKQMEMAEKGAAAIPDLSKAPEEGSPISQMA